MTDLTMGTSHRSFLHPWILASLLAASVRTPVSAQGSPPPRSSVAPSPTTTAPSSAMSTEDRIFEVAESLPGTPTTSDNFSTRWYLIDGWLKDIQAGARSHPIIEKLKEKLGIQRKLVLPITTSDLVSIRIRFYHDPEGGCRRLEATYHRAREMIEHKRRLQQEE